MPLRSLLVISAAPDDRPSTATLTAMVDELRRRPDLRTSLWFLRAGDTRAAHPLLAGADRVVDELRTTFPLPLLDRFGAGVLSGPVRGRVLQRWWAEVDPDVVLLDDGIGARLLVRPTPLAARLNHAAPVDAALEGQPVDHADLWILPPDGPGRAGAEVRLPQQLWDHRTALAYRDADERRRARRRHGLDPGGPLVVGWGDDPWLDGPDLFIRAIARLDSDHGILAHGAWFGLQGDDEDVTRLAEEARRCGVGDRVALCGPSTEAARLCGDVALLPFRAEAPSPAEVREVLVSGAQVVSFPESLLTGPGVHTVAGLDVHAAAAALASCLADDREEVAGRHLRAYDVRPWVDELLSSLSELVDSRGERP